MDVFYVFISNALLTPLLYWFDLYYFYYKIKVWWIGRILKSEDQEKIKAAEKKLNYS
jgi:hypothetical protein